MNSKETGTYSTIKSLEFSISIYGTQMEIYKPDDNAEPEDWEVIDVVPFYRVCMTRGKGDSSVRKFLEGPNSYDLESFNKVLDAILVELKIEALKNFERLEKPHDRIDNWKLRPIQ
jgi:hypothetical protein